MKAYVIVRDGERWYYDTYDQAVADMPWQSSEVIHELVLNERRVTIEVEYSYKVTRTMSLGLGVGLRAERPEILTQVESTLNKMHDGNADENSITIHKATIWENENV